MALQVLEKLLGSFVRIISEESKPPFEMHSFHSGTRPSHYYGTTILKGGKIFYKNGSLTNALIIGNIFIADELNLSSISNIKAISPALEINLKYNIYFPGIENPISIHPNFFFVICQNEPGTIGRNYLPQNIKKRIKEIFYPPQEIEDIVKICKDISKDIYKEKYDDLNEMNAERLGKYMINLNKKNFEEISQWSLRDITKILQRELIHSELHDIFKNIKLIHEILFYTLSSINKEEINNISKQVIDIIVDIFQCSDEDKKKLYISLDIFKNNFCFSENSRIENNPLYKLNTLLEDLFQIILSTDKEPILLIGPSGYKIFLAQKFVSNSQNITNQESSIDQFRNNLILSKI